MMEPTLRNELIRSREEHMRRKAEQHRVRRRTSSPRRPAREYPER